MMRSGDAWRRALNDTVGNINSTVHRWPDIPFFCEQCTVVKELRSWSNQHVGTCDKHRLQSSHVAGNRNVVAHAHHQMMLE